MRFEKLDEITDEVTHIASSQTFPNGMRVITVLEKRGNGSFSHKDIGDILFKRLEKKLKANETAYLIRKI